MQKNHILKDDWPKNGLEQVDSCPICHDKHRKILYEGMQDEVFFCAPGKWTLYQCGACGSAYLNPRPTPDTISLAYKSYYTHGERQPTILSQDNTISKRIKAAIKNSYLQAKYGVSVTESPKFPLGWIIYNFWPTKAQLDRWVRHLPIADKKNNKILDVGCGNGYFSQIAEFIGWDAVGIDIDSEAVKTANQLGVKAIESNLYNIPFDNESFDVVTMNHVIEHLHEPLTALREVLRVLKPGGMIWLSTPNLNSKAHFRDGSKWRGLEPPRHLVMFCHDSLILTCKLAGFPHPIRRRVAWRDSGDWELIVTANKLEKA